MKKFFLAILSGSLFYCPIGATGITNEPLCLKDYTGKWVDIDYVGYDTVHKHYLINIEWEDDYETRWIQRGRLASRIELFYSDAHNCLERFERDDEQYYFYPEGEAYPTDSHEHEYNETEYDNEEDDADAIEIEPQPEQPESDQEDDDSASVSSQNFSPACASMHNWLHSDRVVSSAPNISSERKKRKMSITFAVPVVRKRRNNQDEQFDESAVRVFGPQNQQESIDDVPELYQEDSEIDQEEVDEEAETEGELSSDEVDTESKVEGEVSDQDSSQDEVSGEEEYESDEDSQSTIELDL